MAQAQHESFEARDGAGTTGSGASNREKWKELRTQCPLIPFERFSETSPIWDIDPDHCRLRPVVVYLAVTYTLQGELLQITAGLPDVGQQYGPTYEGSSKYQIELVELNTQTGGVREVRARPKFDVDPAEYPVKPWVFIPTQSGIIPDNLREHLDARKRMNGEICADSIEAEEHRRANPAADTSQYGQQSYGQQGYDQGQQPSLYDGQQQGGYGQSQAAPPQPILVSGQWVLPPPQPVLVNGQWALPQTAAAPPPPPPPQVVNGHVLLNGQWVPAPPPAPPAAPQVVNGHVLLNGQWVPAPPPAPPPPPAAPQVVNGHVLVNGQWVVAPPPAPAQPAEPQGEMAMVLAQLKATQDQVAQQRAEFEAARARDAKEAKEAREAAERASLLGDIAELKKIVLERQSAPPPPPPPAFNLMSVEGITALGTLVSTFSKARTELSAGDTAASAAHAELEKAKVEAAAKIEAARIAADGQRQAAEIQNKGAAELAAQAREDKLRAAVDAKADAQFQQITAAIAATKAPAGQSPMEVELRRELKDLKESFARGASKDNDPLNTFFAFSKKLKDSGLIPAAAEKGDGANIFQLIERYAPIVEGLSDSAKTLSLAKLKEADAKNLDAQARLNAAAAPAAAEPAPAPAAAPPAPTPPPAAAPETPLPPFMEVRTMGGGMPAAWNQPYQGQPGWGQPQAQQEPPFVPAWAQSGPFGGAEEPPPPPAPAAQPQYPMGVQSAPAPAPAAAPATFANPPVVPPAPAAEEPHWGPLAGAAPAPPPVAVVAPAAAPPAAFFAPAEPPVVVAAPPEVTAPDGPDAGDGQPDEEEEPPAPTLNVRVVPGPTFAPFAGGGRAFAPPASGVSVVTVEQPPPGEPFALAPPPQG